jgi:hypothetical protein
LPDESTEYPSLIVNTNDVQITSPRSGLVQQRVAVEMYANAAEEGSFNFPEGSPGPLGVKKMADGKTIMLPADYQIIAFYDYLWPAPIREGALVRVFRLGRISEFKYDGKQWRQTKIVLKVGGK